jgi:TolB-like protein
MIQLLERSPSGSSHPVKAARAVRLGLAAALLLSLAAGCSSSRMGGTVYVHPNADLAVFERVAVLPLENLSNDRYAAARVREVLNVEMAAMGICEVVDSTRVNRALRDRDLIEVTSLGQETLILLAEDLGVQGLLMGSVLELSQTRTSTFTAPEVSLSLRLVDAQTGIVAWSVTDARKGLPLETRLFGVGEKTQTEVIRELVRTLMSDLYRAAGS